MPPLPWAWRSVPIWWDGCFDPEAVEIEKDKLKKRLQAEINDKRLYCIRQARRKFYGDAPEGIERDGYLEEVPGLTPAELYEAYQEILRTATLDVMVLGADPAAICVQLEQAMAGIERAPAALAGFTAQPRALPRHFVEKLPGVTQAKLCMLFTSAAPLEVEEIDVCRLAMSLFGGVRPQPPVFERAGKAEPVLLLRLPACRARWVA